MEDEIKKITLKLLGPNLPLGIATSDGTIHKTIETRPWRAKEEKELGQLREDHANATLGRYVSIVLGTMCNKIGPYDLASMSVEERIIHISQMWMGDVFYAYCWLRKKSLGDAFGMRVNCSRCGAEFEFDADLNTLEVSCADSLEKLLWTYTLRSPFKIRGETITKMVLGPARWSIIDSAATSGAGFGIAKMESIRGSLHALPEAEKISILAPDELDDMSKTDIESILREMDRKALGPEMVIEVKHAKCRATTKVPIDWRYDHFFGSSIR